MKRGLSILLALALMVSIMPRGAMKLSFTAAAETDGYYTYTVSGGKATITDADNSISGDVTIPSTLGGYPVTSIGYDAFYGCKSLTSITIPDGVTSIGRYAFDDCNSLTDIVVAEDNTTYSSQDGVLFSKNKTTLITYPAGKTAAVYIIPDSVTSIGNYAFEDCESLTSVTIGDSVTSIGSSAFYSCSSLKSITIGDSVTSIGSYVFSYCRSLTSVTIGDSVTSIGWMAFYDCDSLTSVTIPDSVTSIGYEAFSTCNLLTSMTIPDSVTSIG